MKRLRTILFILITILLAAAIYKFSSQDYFQSNDLSRSVVQYLASIFNIEIADMTPINRIMRKVFHVLQFMLLTMSIFLIMKSLKYKLLKCSIISFLGCLVLAAVDEIHQLFVPARTGSIRDVMIDLIGGAVGVILSVGIVKVVRIIKNKNHQKRLN